MQIFAASAISEELKQRAQSSGPRVRQQRIAHDRMSQASYRRCRRRREIGGGLREHLIDAIDEVEELRILALARME